MCVSRRSGLGSYCPLTEGRSSAVEVDILVGEDHHSHLGAVVRRSHHRRRRDTVVRDSMTCRAKRWWRVEVGRLTALAERSSTGCPFREASGEGLK
jgi:hypothetical protein